MLSRCPYCHRWILSLLMDRHTAKHTKVGESGQQESHVTIPPDARYEGSLDGVPQAYRHTKCGVSTRMPEQIIRSYLVNPFLYNDFTFCCGCKDYVHSSELTWHETGQTLFDYTKELQAEFVRIHGGPPRKREQHDSSSN